MVLVVYFGQFLLLILLRDVHPQFEELLRSEGSLPDATNFTKLVVSHV